MANRSMLITAAKNLSKSFLPNLICKVEYSTNIMNRNHNRRDMIRSSENGIVPIYNAVEASYIIPMMH